jgi:uncharacterized protein YcbK (DUF882 family)
MPAPRLPEGRRQPETRRSQPGYVVLVGTSARWKGLARSGKVIRDEARQGIERVLASWRSGERHPIDPRLIHLIIDVSDHFGGRPLRIVSGYRPYSPAQYTPHSHHNRGEAVDFVVDGVPNHVLSEYCRSLGAVGVGDYPNSSFVHLDVRSTPAHWVDESRPGQPPRYQRKLARNGSRSALPHRARQVRARGRSE